MRKIALFALILSNLMFFGTQVKAEINSLGADGPAATFFIAEIFANNLGDEAIDCSEEDSSLLIKQILAVPKNKKLISSANNKNVKNFLKQLGISGSLPAFFKEAALATIEEVCSGDDIDEEEELPDFEEEL